MAQTVAAAAHAVPSSQLSVFDDADAGPQFQGHLDDVRVLSNLLASIALPSDVLK